MSKTDGSESGSRRPGVVISFSPRQERRLIRPKRSFRHIDFQIKVGEIPAGQQADRTPLALALVLDRSGSMSGDKIETAKKAAMAVVDRLTSRDRVGLVVFDDQIDVVQPAEPVTERVKTKIKLSLAEIQARASTALHEGWLTGCRLLAGDTAYDSNRELARCFLLTDGLANVGETDPEQIASDAANIRRETGIGTSTFGIGPDYDESLLGPMAVAGGGQFHNLRTSVEIANTFIGELGDLLAVAARRVQLEIQVDPDTEVDVVSAYYKNGQDGKFTMDIGDLLAGSEQHVVIRFGFHQKNTEATQIVKSRLLWADPSGETTATGWQESVFTYASHEECDKEEREPEVMRQVGLRHAERAQREAMRMNQQGKLDEAKVLLKRVAERIMEYAGSDQDLKAAVGELGELQEEMKYQMDTMAAKERIFESLRLSRFQTDKRGRQV